MEGSAQAATAARTAIVGSRIAESSLSGRAAAYRIKVTRFLPLLVLAQICFAAVAPADLRAHVEFLSSDLLEGRNTPSKGLDIAGEYIAAQFRRAGLKPQPDGTYFQVASEGSRNVVGVLPGADAKLRDRHVLVTAHYDHVGVRKEGEGDRIYNGANDNASGVASMIEIARMLSAGNIKPRQTIVFIAYYGEEKGMLGSRYYAENPLYPLESTVAQINLEQTGRTDDIEGPNPKTVNVTGFDYSQVADILKPAAAANGIRVVRRAKWSEDAFERSDNEALAKKGVPAHTLSVAYMFPDYHRVGDEAGKLNYGNMAAVTNAVAAGVLALANRTEPPHWYEGAPMGGTGVSTDLAKPVKKPVSPAKPAAAKRQKAA